MHVEIISSPICGHYNVEKICSNKISEMTERNKQ